MNLFAKFALAVAVLLTAMTNVHAATGSISLAAGNVNLTMLDGATDQYANAPFSIVINDVAKVKYTGNNAVSTPVVDVGIKSPDLRDAGSDRTHQDRNFTGNAYILAAIPEPSVYMLLGVGLLLCGQRFFRRRRSS